MKQSGAYRDGEEKARPARVAMPRAPWLVVPGATMHVVARCNHRAFEFTTPQDFTVLLRRLQLMVASYELTLYAYTLMSNHVHLLLKAPPEGVLARPLRWFMTESARAFHPARKRTGHFWERRYRACLVEDDTYGLAALRYVDRNPVRAGLVADPSTYPWSSCAAYALGAPHRLITLHPSYLGLAPDSPTRQAAYLALLAPSADAAADTRDARWSTHTAPPRRRAALGLPAPPDPSRRPGPPGPPTALRIGFPPGGTHDRIPLPCGPAV